MFNVWERLGHFNPYSAVFCPYSDETKRPLWWKIPLKTPGSAISETLNFKCPFKMSQELVPLVQVPKPPTIHYQLAT